MLATRHVSAARVLTFGAVGALAGCGGGFGSVLPASHVPSAVSAALPGAHAPGTSTLVYAGSIDQTTSGSKPQQFTVTQTVDAFPGTYGGAKVTVYSGTQTAKSGAKTSTTQFVADAAQVADKVRKGDDVRVLAASSHSSTLSQKVVYGTGNGVIDQVPEVPQARWTDSAARTEGVVDSYAGSSYRERYFADGSYRQSSVPVEGLHATAESYADGNGIYDWPFEGGSQNSSIAFNPPDNGKLEVYAVNFSAHVTEVITLKSWYPSQPPVLNSDSFVDAGTVRIPSSCGAAKQFGTTATELDETSARLDIVFGQYETIQSTRYVVPKYGVACFVLHDDVKTYYNYDVLALAAKPLTETVTEETLGLHSAKLSKSSGAAFSAAVPLDATVAQWRAAVRMQATRAIYASLHLIKERR